MSKINELEFSKDAKSSVDFENMPEEVSFAPPPYPGAYEFILPLDLSGLYEKIVRTIGYGKDAKENQERLEVQFNSPNELLIVQTTPQNKDYLNTTFRCRINNAERLNKDNEAASDMDRLIGVLGGVIPKNAPMVQYAKEFNQHGGKRFGADVEWTAYCNTERKRFIFDEQTKATVEDSKMGCGQRYAQREYTTRDGTKVTQIPKEDTGMWAGEFECIPECRAMIRCFGQLRRFRESVGAGAAKQG